MPSLISSQRAIASEPRAAECTRYDAVRAAHWPQSWRRAASCCACLGLWESSTAQPTHTTRPVKAVACAGPSVGPRFCLVVSVRRAGEKGTEAFLLLCFEFLFVTSLQGPKSFLTNPAWSKITRYSRLTRLADGSVAYKYTTGAPMRERFRRSRSAGACVALRRATCVHRVLVPRLSLVPRRRPESRSRYESRATR